MNLIERQRSLQERQVSLQDRDKAAFDHVMLFTGVMTIVAFFLWLGFFIHKALS